jgi:hypothetical protein
VDKKSYTIERRLSKLATEFKRLRSQNDADFSSLFQKLVRHLSEQPTGIAIDADVDGPLIQVCKQFGLDAENNAHLQVLVRLLAHAIHGPRHKRGRPKGAWPRWRLRALDERFKSQLKEGKVREEAAKSIAETSEFKGSNGKALTWTTLKRVWTNYQGAEKVDILELVISLAKRARIAETSATMSADGPKSAPTNELADLVEHIWRERDA